jgi:hypothetical protein
MSAKLADVRFTLEGGHKSAQPRTSAFSQKRTSAEKNLAEADFPICSTFIQPAYFSGYLNS